MTMLQLIILVQLLISSRAFMCPKTRPQSIHRDKNDGLVYSPIPTDHSTQIFSSPSNEDLKNTNKRRKKQSSKKKSITNRTVSAAKKTERDEEGPDGPVAKTISGGPSLILSMATRMLVWDDQDYLNDDNIINDRSNIKEVKKPRKKTTVLPRWHPTSGIADVNANFRVEPPSISKLGYAALIRRNSRKRGKPGLWRHAYRMYSKMRSIEIDQIKSEASGADMNAKKPILKIERENTHFESAINACAKLGLWREALFIFYEAKGIEDYQKSLEDDMEDKDAMEDEKKSLTSLAQTMKRRKPITITKYMMLSVIESCVKGMKSRNRPASSKKIGSKTEFTIDEIRLPLDKARDLILSEEIHITPTAMHINPVAAGYTFLGLHKDANSLLCGLDDKNIKDIEEKREKRKNKYRGQKGKFGFAYGFEPNDSDGRINPVIEEETTEERDWVYKDEASYSILVKNSISQGDWCSAIESLKTMNEAGVYANSRSLNAWSETASKRERRPRRTTWKKQREQILTYGLQETQSAQIGGTGDELE